MIYKPVTMFTFAESASPCFRHINGAMLGIVVLMVATQFRGYFLSHEIFNFAYIKFFQKTSASVTANSQQCNSLTKRFLSSDY